MGTTPSQPADCDGEGVSWTRIDLPATLIDPATLANLSSRAEKEQKGSHFWGERENDSGCASVISAAAARHREAELSVVLGGSAVEQSLLALLDEVDSISTLAQTAAFDDRYEQRANVLCRRPTSHHLFQGTAPLSAARRGTRRNRPGSGRATRSRASRRMPCQLGQATGGRSPR